MLQPGLAAPIRSGRGHARQRTLRDERKDGFNIGRSPFLIRGPGIESQGQVVPRDALRLAMATVTALPPVLFPEARLEIGLSTALTFARE